jgi:hypothetical protein
MATILSLFIVPVLYIVIKSFEMRVQRRRSPVPAEGPMDESRDGHHEEVVIGSVLDRDHERR